jgi:Ca2+-binding RTX toxin-like protein/subtilisin-like proprotein convertase family protein
MTKLVPKNNQFGPDYFTVKSKDGSIVAAKWLDDGNGNYIMAPVPKKVTADEKPYIVPADYSLDAALARYRPLGDASSSGEGMLFEDTSSIALNAILANAVRASSSDDLQRTYNGLSFNSGDGFVKDFTPAASFHFGIVGSALGMSSGQLVAGGGIYNKAKSLVYPLDTSGEFWNAHDNAVHIREGSDFYQAYLALPPVPSEPNSLPPLQPLLDIQITPAPQPTQRIEDESAARNDVSNGFVTNHLTHQIAFKDNTLDKSDFFSVQVASLTTGGVRPGEIQLDPNAQPSQHLSQFYRDSAAETAADFSLRNAVMLNGLSANTTQNIYVDPLLLDLTGNGVQMTPISDGVLFDVDNSGTLKRTGWAAAGTGMLVMATADGLVTNISQMISEYYGGTPGTGAQAGERPYRDAFAALASQDGNADALISAADPAWSQLRVWVDASRDGSVQAGELKSLDELNITELRLAAEPTPGDVRQGNTVVARGSFVMNGEAREALAVNFLADSVATVLAPQEGGTRLVSTTGDTRTTAYASAATSGETLDAAQLQVSNLYGGSGDDTLIAAPGGSWLVGGGGANQYVGGAGNDVFVISASDAPSAVKGGGGRDTLLVVGDGGVTVNLAKAGVTVAQGGRGTDYFVSGGSNGVFLKGGSGDATLVGGAGDDVLVGGSGRNVLVGGTGKAVIYAGPKGDRILASVGGSIIYAGGGDDRILGREGNDVIEVGHGNAVIDGGGGINLVTLHGGHGDYLIEPGEAGVRITDKVVGRDGSVLLNNIQKLNFAGLSAVDLSSNQAMPVNDVLAVDHQGAALDRGRALRFAAAQLLDNDQPLLSQGPLRIAAVSDAVGGTVSLDESGDVSFTPTPVSDGVMSFKYTVVDQAGNPATSIVAMGTGERAVMRASVSLLTAGQPTDPLAAQQWYIGDIGVSPVWADYSGKGVRIGQFEPGGQFSTGPEIFDTEHPDLAANVDPIWLQTQTTNGTLPTLKSNHATMVAGVMVGARNDVGGIGIAPGATLGGHYLANSGEDVTALGNMLNYDVTNHSWSFSTPFGLTALNGSLITTAGALITSAQYAGTNGRGGLGSVAVTSGGNNRATGGSSQDSFTNNHRFAIQVAAINAQADLSTLSIGATPFSNPGASLLVAAPGSNVLSTSRALETERGSLFGNPYSAMQGTSFAAPIVSGVIALMLEANPALGYRDVQQILAVSAQQVSDPQSQWSDNGARRWNGGGLHTSIDYGFGRIDARAAVRLAESWTLQSTAANLTSLEARSSVDAQALQAGESLSQVVTLASGVNIEHLEVDLFAEAGRLGDLTLTLISPTGTRSVLLDRAGRAPGSADDGTAVGNPRAGAFNYRFMSTHAWGEDSAGDWTLQLSNAATGLPATLHNWTLRAHGAAASADDQYVYTNEFGRMVAADPGRGILDENRQGTPGGRDTLNAAAISGDSVLDLATGTIDLGGTPLAVSNPASIVNLLSGDGNDRLVAGATGSLLHGGRGHNSLTGGAGKDLFVVQRRRAGQDTLVNFEPGKGEVIKLVGFAGKSFSDLVPEQQGDDVVIALPDEQRLVLAGQVVAAVTESNVRFQPTLGYDPEYFTATSLPEEPASRPGLVTLNGGGGGVRLSTDASGSFVGSLSGIIYDRVGVEANTFLVAEQVGVADYGNSVRGFRHGIDKIDLTSLGISSLAELTFAKEERAVINGVALINGVSISRPRGADEKPTRLVYLDGLEIAQVTADDFLFAQPASHQPAAAPALLATVTGMTDLVAPALPTTGEHRQPSADALIEAMAAFAPAAAGAFDFASAPLFDQAPLLAANAA